MQPQELLKQLHWRYATQKFDPHKKIPSEIWKVLEQALVLTPSSYGLQPWHFYVVEDAQVRLELRQVSWDQSQITDASHLVVFAVQVNLNTDDVKHYIERAAQVRSVSEESLFGLKRELIGHVTNPDRDINLWAGQQVYIALGNFLTCAAVLGVDACPMAGINPKEYDRILGMESQGFHSLCAAAAGYRAPDDRHACEPKVRFPAHEVISHVGKRP